ncbi:MAG: hypothetical protein AAB886_02435 [Patescibacteria group bacterium]
MTNETYTKKPHAFARTGLYVARWPGRFASKIVEHRLAHRGFGHRLFDFASIAIIISAIVFTVSSVANRDPGRQMEFTAVVAPKEIVSGGDSTLSIFYRNESKKTLKDALLSLSYPPYFVLQGVDNPSFEVATNTTRLGDLVPGANGMLKIRGVMFGAFGGEQTFSSVLSYSYDNNKTGSQTRAYSFSPSASTLSTFIDLPPRLVSGQKLKGAVEFKNEGKVDFPEVALKAEFPKTFSLTNTSLKQRGDGTWIVPSFRAGEQKSFTFEGRLGEESGESADFRFTPSFTFGNERFAQKTEVHTVSIIPSPVEVSLEVDESVVSSSGADGRIRWSVNDGPNISELKIQIEGAEDAKTRKTPIFLPETGQVSGEITLRLFAEKPNSENASATFTPVASFILNDTGEEVFVTGNPVERKIATDLSLFAFARYFTPSGDQLGRGPLPPKVGKETTYWAFWNIQDTVNRLSSVTVSATLGSNVSFPSRQSVTQGQGVIYDSLSRTISWKIDDLAATEFSNRVAGASFALVLSPIPDQAGKIATLLADIKITATDSSAGLLIQKSLPNLTTKIKEDAGVIAR